MALPSKYSIAHAVFPVASGGHPVRLVDANGVALDDPTQIYSTAHPVLETDINGVVASDAFKVVSTPRLVTVSPNGIPVVTVDSTGAVLGAVFGAVSGGGGGGAGLAAPTLGYPSPAASNPTTIPIIIPPDWQTGDILTLSRSANSSMSAPTLLTHTLTDADIVAGTVSMGLLGITLTGIVYFQAYGTHGGTVSSNKSAIVSWGDTTAPVITTASTFSTTEQTQLALALTTTDTGGVPALVSDGTSPGWYISGGADRLNFQIGVVSNVAYLQIYNNGTIIYATPTNFPPNSANPYVVQITAVDYNGNQSTALTESVTFTQIDSAPNAFTFTNVNNAALSTQYTSNTVTIAGLQAGFNITSSLSGTGFTYSKNGGAYQPPGSFTIANGDTLTIQAISQAANNLNESCTVTVGTYSTTWTIATPITTTTFNPAVSPGNITLSNGNLTAAHSGTTTGSVITVNGYSTGKHVVRFHIDVAGSGSGLESSTEPNNNFPSQNCAVYSDGSLWINATNTGNIGAPVAGDTIDIAFDMDAKRAWFRKNTTWLGAGGDPTAAGAGFDISALAATLYPCYISNVASAQSTLQSVTLTGFTSVI